LSRVEVVQWSARQLTSAVETIEAELSQVAMAIEGGLAEELSSRPADALRDDRGAR